MKLVDVNILLYAVNTAAAHHRAVLTWWQDAVAGDEPVGLASVVLLGFLRLSTSPIAFPNPLSVQDAIARVDAWLAEANVRLVAEAENYWPILRDLLSESGAAGNLTTDAYLASLAISRGATMVSTDTDFARFPQLQWENPLANHPAG
jgi:uncharacterized protein